MIRKYRCHNYHLSQQAIYSFLICLLLSSCLKETAVPIESAFTIEASEDKTSPVTIQLKNESYGADEYEWIFEGGIPSSSNQRAPGKVVFTQAGVHKSLDNVMSDFLYLIDNHLSGFTKTRKGKHQITSFLNELMQSTDKFKAGATTLEVIHNAQKYIPSKYYNTLSTLQLEDLIAYADDAGDFRFDIKWSALAPETNKPISVFIDTKNYSSASNMFKDLGQFKAYLGAIDNFDQLYIIQQGGRGVTREQIIAQLERAIAKDAESVFETKPQLWKNMGIRDFEELKRLCNRQGLSKDPNFQPFRNMILTTK